MTDLGLRQAFAVTLFGCFMFLPMVAVEAFTIKTGEVLGSDGQVHVGASPQERQALIDKARQSDKSAGVIGRNVYVISGDTVTFVPVGKIAGKTDETIKEIIGDAVVADVTGIEGLKLSTLETARDVSIATEVPMSTALVEQVAKEAIAAAGRSALEPEIAKQTQELLARITGTTQFDHSSMDLAKLQIEEIIEDIDEEALEDLKGIVDEIDRVEMAAVEAMEAQEAVSAPGGLLDQFNSGEISEQELMEQSQGMAGFDGHCETDC